MALAEKIPMIENDYPTLPGQRRKPHSRQRLKMIIPSICILLCFSVGNVILQSLVVDKEFQIRKMQSKIKEREREMLKLRIDIAKLESFDRVRNIARNELGMKIAGPEDYQIIPAVPVEQDGFAESTEHVADSGEQSVFGKISVWLGDIGKTMANAL